MNPTKQRIIFIATEFAPGMIPFASSIINTLNTDPRFDVYAIVVNSGKYSYKGKIIIPEEKICYIEYPTSKSIKLLYKFYPYKIIQTIQKFKKEIHPHAIHLLTGEFSLAPYFFFKKSNDNLYYTVHDLHPHEIEKNSLFSILRRYIVIGNKILRNKIPNLTTCSIHQYEELKGIYPQKNIVFSHFPSLITPQISGGMQVVPELINISNYILFIGNINRYKGVDFLINTLKGSDILKKHKLVIAGKGGHYDNLIDTQNIIRINRFINDEEIKDLFSKSCLVIYPYRSATMSGVLSLAYYFNKKVVMTDIPFFREYSCKNSFYFKKEDPKDLEENILKALSSKSEEVNTYLKFYDPQMIINDLYKLYNKTQK